MELIHKFSIDGLKYVLDVNTGSIMEIDELVYDLLEDDRVLTLDEAIEKFSSKYPFDQIKEALDEINNLVEEGVLYTKDMYEEKVKKNNEQEYMKAMCLNVVHDCNLKCKYCFADEGEYKGKREIMTFDVAKRALDFLISQSGPRYNIEVDLFGGEPLMAFDMIKQLVDYARSIEKQANKNIRFTITTNGLLLNDEIIEYLNKNMKNIILSIDGRKEVNDKMRLTAVGTGSYDIIIDKIKKLVDGREEGQEYYLRGTYTHQNLDFSNDFMHLVNEGFKEISLEPVVVKDDSEISIRFEDLEQIYDEYDKIYRYLKDMIDDGKKINFYHYNINLQGGPCVYKRVSACGAGFEYIAITPSGDIYPCHQFVGKKEFVIGNVNDLLNYGIREPQIVEEFKEANIYKKEECNKCWARFYCSGGCQANNHEFTNSILKPYKIGCYLQKKRIEMAIALKVYENSKDTYINN